MNEDDRPDISPARSKALEYKAFDFMSYICRNKKASPRSEAFRNVRA